MRPRPRLYRPWITPLLLVVGLGGVVRGDDLAVRLAGGLLLFAGVRRAGRVVAWLLWPYQSWTRSVLLPDPEVVAQRQDQTLADLSEHRRSWWGGGWWGRIPVLGPYQARAVGLQQRLMRASGLRYLAWLREERRRFPGNEQR